MLYKYIKLINLLFLLNVIWFTVSLNDFKKLFFFFTVYLGLNKNQFSNTFLHNNEYQAIYLYNNIKNYDILFANNINFNNILLVIIVSFGFVLFLLTQANLLNLSLYPNSTFDSEKYSPYECGFSPFRTERAQFDIKFYLVALLFLVFDVELMFLLPYCLSYFYLGFYSYIIFIIFFTILVIGFLVEWAVGMLTWKGEENSPTFIFIKNKNLLKNSTEIKYNKN